MISVMMRPASSVRLCERVGVHVCTWWWGEAGVAKLALQASTQNQNASTHLAVYSSDDWKSAALQAVEAILLVGGRASVRAVSASTLHVAPSTLRAISAGTFACRSIDIASHQR